MKRAKVRIVTNDVPRLRRFYQEVIGLLPIGDDRYLEFPAPGLTLAIASQQRMNMIGLVSCWLTQPFLSSEIPPHAPTRHHDAGDLSPRVLFPLRPRVSFTFRLEIFFFDLIAPRYEPSAPAMVLSRQQALP